MAQTRDPLQPREPVDVLDWGDPSDLPVDDVREVFLTLSKALRAYQLYDPDNPVYKKFLASLAEALDKVLDERDSVQIIVEEDRLTWMGEEVYRGENRSDSLSFVFYRDGIRDITFKAGLGTDEVEGLLVALHRTRNARGEGEDLVTMLWDLDMSHFSYSAVELGGDGPAMDLTGLGVLSDFDASAILEIEVPEEGVAADQGSEAPSVADTVRTEDFNPTLYALEEAERVYLRTELEKEMNRDLRGEVLNALFDRLEEPGRPDRQLEILEVLRTLLPNFLSRGALAEAGRVIGEIGDIAAKPGVLPADASDIAESLEEDLSSPEVVVELIRALDNDAVAKDPAELSGLLSHLRPAALTALLKGAEETRNTSTAQILRSAVMGIAEKNRDVVIQLLGSDDPSVVAGAVRLAGRINLAEAGDALARVLEQGPKQLQRVVVETAQSVPSSVLAAALQRMLEDEDRELRVATARALGEMKYAPAAEQFRRIIEDKGFRDSDVTEKVVIFEAYGSLAGDAGVSFLDKLLNGKTLFGRREPSEIRAGAALALGKISSQSADQALAKAAGDGDPVVRSALGRATEKVEAEA